MARNQYGYPEDLYRGSILAFKGLRSEIATATATAGAATCNAYVGQITSEALTTAAAAEYTLTLTNDKIAAGDIVLASVDPGSSAGTPGIGGCKVTANTVIITVTNLHAANAFDAAIAVRFLVVKAAA